MRRKSPAVGTVSAPAWLAAGLLGLGAGLPVLGADDSRSPGTSSSYLETIKPVLKERCYACHGALKQKAGLRLDTAERIREGADGGRSPIISTGDPGASELVHRLESPDEDHRMPPEGEALEAAEIAAIRAWIAAGAPLPPEEAGDEDPDSHWAFRPIERPDIPGEGHPVDRLLAVGHASMHLEPLPVEPERSLLLRRLYLDLVGLPPTREQLRDTRPWSEIVDELLASPHHGERWARHWMDVWRYSDWYGLGAQLRNSQKHLWHWRDWIVESLNEDKGYDRMIQEMIAGDELAPGNQKVERATGFLARNYFLFNRTTWLDNTIEHTGKAFLGLTLNCAKCHDHKYDPVSMEDYYRFRALFEPHQVRLDPVPGVTDLEQDGLPRAFDDHLEAKTWIHRRGDPKQPDTETEIAPGVPTFLADFAPAIQPVSLPRSAFAPGARDYVQRDHLAAAEAELAAARESLEAAEVALAEARQRDSTGKPRDEKRESTPVTGNADEPWLHDSFDAPDEATWELIGEGWRYEKGTLVQGKSSRERAMLRSREAHPRDFELTCRYTTTGGDTYRSVTFRFDLSDDGKDANFVYTSAHAPGPKVQVAHTLGGQTAYPPAGRVARPIEVGQAYTLRFAVRDRLVNVWLDDAFLLAYQLPRRHPEGRLALSGFDATAAFDEITVRELPPHFELTEAKGGAKPADSLESVESRVALNEARLEAATTRLGSLRATIVAEAEAPGSSKREALERAAARWQAEGKAATAAHEVAKQELAGDAKKLAAAKKTLAAARTVLDEESYRYAPLKVSRKALETPEHKEADYPANYPETSTGRRTMLARWITAPEHPLTARVAVNQVWMRHFGTPLVESVFDFGRQAPRPVQAELLDYLAAEFRESGWSFKHLHRLIVTSEAYRRSASLAGADAATRERDPENRYYWRMNSRRMESQVVRDSLLHLAGELDLEMGGASLAPGKASRRRSLYYHHSPDRRDRFLMIFDDADLLQCYRRTESVVPQQALALANSSLALEMAEALAERVSAEGKIEDRESFARESFHLVLGRAPGASELAECLAFTEELEAVLAEGPDLEGDALEKRLRTRLVHALLNHNDFVTIR